MALSLSRGLGAESASGYGGSLFKCNTTICYGADGGATHALFKETQYQMNRAGRAVFGTRWSAISVDGFIGTRTVTAGKMLFPKVAQLQKYAAPPNYQTLAQWISSSRPLFPSALRQLADQLTGQAENPATVQNRDQAYAQEGPAATSSGATNVPGVYVPTTPGSESTPPTQQPVLTPVGPPDVRDQLQPQQKGKGFVWVVAGVAVVGLIGTAAMVAKRRRRRR